MRTINVGLVGFGLAGRAFHAPILTSVEGFALTKVVERHAAQSKAIYPDVDVVTDAADLLKDPAIELLVIAVPNAAHYDLARQAIDAGKHVVVEKPFTVTSREAYDLAKRAEERGVALSVYHNRRFDADFLTIQQLHAAGRFGRIINYEARFDRFRPIVKLEAWREDDAPGTGMLYDLGSHLIDQALVLFGAPEYVTGFLAKEREAAKTVDAFEVVLEYAGTRAVLRAGMMARDHALRYTINGTNGSFVKCGLDVQEEKLKQGKFPNDDANWGVEPEDIWGRFLREEGESLISERISSVEGDYRRYYQDIYQAITERRTPYVSAKDGAAVINVIELAMQSSREKKSLKYEYN